MKRSTLTIALAVLAATASFGAAAEETNPNIVHRQGIYKVAAGHMTAMKAIIALKFDAARDQLGYHATALREALMHHRDAYPAGSDKGETKAKPEIWTRSDDFKAAGRRAMEATDRLVEATKGTDMAVVAAAFKDVGAACKNCHDDFRKE